MNGFRQSVEADIEAVFLQDDFAEAHNIAYDGKTYSGVMCVVSKIKEKERVTIMRDHAQGLYLVTEVLHVALKDLDGNMPEKGALIKISKDGFMRSFYIAASGCSMGMLRVELEAYDE